MHLIGLARLGTDAVVRFLPDGTAVANLALAFNYGPKGADGKRATQWVDAGFFGERAQKLAEYLVKGQMIEVHLSDPHMETYTARDGTPGTKMVARVAHLEFAGSPPQRDQQQAAPAQQQRPAPAARQQQAGGTSSREQALNRQAAASRGAVPNFTDMDDDIPF